jgi:hypothetical protein
VSIPPCTKYNTAPPHRPGRKKGPSGTLGKNVCQAGHLIRTAVRMTNNVSAAMQPPRFAAGAACRFASLAQFFRFGCLRSGSSYGLEHIASSFRLQFYLLRSLLPRSLRSLRSAWSLRAAETASLIAAQNIPVHPLPHNVRHLPVAPSLIYLIWPPFHSGRTTKVERG